MRTLPVTVALAGAAFVFALAQDNKQPAFEVASVKVHANLADTNMSINDKPGGQLECSNVSLHMVMSFAYNLRDYQILNLPPWADDDRYDIAAKPSADDAANEPARYSDSADGILRQRTRALLADRFGLKTHDEQREMNVYSLVLAKGGSKLQPTQDKGPFPQTSWNATRMICKQVTMARFAKTLGGRMNRYVIDNTGLTGAYDFHMEFQPDEPAGKGGTSENALGPSGPTFTQALEEQLGLRLVAAKGAVPYLIVDHVEKPSAN